MAIEFGTFTDERDGQTYKTVKIADQEWMAENLRYKCEGSVAYDDNEDYVAKYGRLYDWDTAQMTLNDGWHLPTEKEFKALADNLNKKEKLPKGKVCDALFAEELCFDPSCKAIAGTSGMNIPKAGYRCIFKGKPSFSKLDESSYFWYAGEQNGEGCYWSPTMAFEPFLMNLRRKDFMHSVRLVRQIEVPTKKKSAPKPVEKAESTFTDSRDGYTYKTVTIGKQVWLAENLRFKCEGAIALEGKDENIKLYGYLYNSEAIKKAIPEGWHLPSIEEFKTLKKTVKRLTKCEKDCEGKELKSKEGWIGKLGTDTFGFNLLPGGYVSERWGDYTTEKGSATFWASDFNEEKKLRSIWGVPYRSDSVYDGAISPLSSLSIRLIKD